MERLPTRFVQATILTLTGIAFIAFLVRSMLTGEDIPSGWLSIIGGSWGALLGVQELLRRGGKNGA
jgi:hypothetical protein